MPYIIKPVNNGYKVCKKDNPNKCFSNKPLTEEKAIKQEKAIILSELEGSAAPLIARFGGKSRLKKIIVNDYFPKDYEDLRYVEPFIGGGSIFFYKEPSKEEIINDKDESVYEIFKGFQKYKPEKIRETMILLKKDKPTFLKIKDMKPTTDFTKFIKNYYLRKNSYLGISGAFHIRDKQKTKFSSYIDEYYDRLKNVIILNEDFKKVIKDYDSKNTFFYLDPPYEKSEKLYEYFDISISDIYNVLKNIKGKFLLSYNNSDDARELFKDYNIYEIKTKYAEPNKGGQNREVIELLISNYEPDLKEKLKGGNLNYMDIDNDLYLTIAKERAKQNGYDPKLLEWADDMKHKLKYNGVKFGRKGYNDFIIYAIKAHNGDITKEEALKHRKNYLARASKIKGNWKDNKESPNNLAMSILW
jgi:DNA adenine methylase